MELKRDEKIIFFVLLVILIGSVLLIQYNLVTKEKETYTEVYFSGPIAETAEKNSKLPVSFFISNHEHEGVEYTYRIYLGEKLKESGKVMVNSEEKMEIIEEILIDADNEKSKV